MKLLAYSIHPIPPSTDLFHNIFFISEFLLPPKNGRFVKSVNFPLINLWCFFDKFINVTLINVWIFFDKSMDVPLTKPTYFIGQKINMRRSLSFIVKQFYLILLIQIYIFLHRNWGNWIRTKVKGNELISPLSMCILGTR